MQGTCYNDHQSHLILALPIFHNGWESFGDAGVAPAAELLATLLLLFVGLLLVKRQSDNSSCWLAMDNRLYLWYTDVWLVTSQAMDVSEEDCMIADNKKTAGCRK